MTHGSSQLQVLIELLSRSKDLGLGDIVLEGATREEILFLSLIHI